MNSLPLAGVGHAQPRLLRWQWRALLQQFYGDVVGGADEGHAAVAGRAVDGHAVLLQMCAEGVDVFNAVGQMTEVTTFAVDLRVPVVSQLDLRVVIAGRGQKYQGETPLFALAALQFLEAQLAALKIQRRFEIGDSYHGVQIFHCAASWCVTA